MYHDFSEASDRNSGSVDVKLLRAQLSYLQSHFHVVPLSHIVRSLTTGQLLDKFAVALTVDDGRRNFYDFCFPLLKEFSMPATFFVVSSFICGQEWLWTDKVLWLSEQPSASAHLGADKIDELFRKLNQLRPEARNEEIAGMAAGMGVVVPKEAPPKYAPCSWTELREMANSGLIEIGSHTATHPILSSITDTESWHELTVSRAQIEDGIGKQISSFCFPNGKPGDYRASQVQQIIDAGYTSAVVASPGLVQSGMTAYELPRIGISGVCDELSFRKSLDGTEYYQAKLQKRLGQPRSGLATS